MGKNFLILFLVFLITGLFFIFSYEKEKKETLDKNISSSSNKIIKQSSNTNLIKEKSKEDKKIVLQEEKEKLQKKNESIEKIIDKMDKLIEENDLKFENEKIQNQKIQKLKEKLQNVKEDLESNQ